MANKPNNPSLWSKAKSLARQKFDVYPSAYANGWAAKYYKSKGGTWRKGEKGMQVPSKAKMQGGGQDRTYMYEDNAKPASFRERVFRGDYDKERKSFLNPQVTTMSERGTAKNIMSSGDASRRERVRIASEYTGIPRREVRNQNPTAVGGILRSMVPTKRSGTSSGQSPFWGASRCLGGGCLDPKGGTTYKKGGSKSKLKQAYLNKYK